MDSVEFCRQRLLTLWDEWAAKGGNQTTLATACGVAQAQISLWLKDLRAGVVPRVQSLAVLCKGFDVPIASLFPPEGAALPAVLTQPDPSVSPNRAAVLALLDKFDDSEMPRIAGILRARLSGKDLGKKPVKANKLVR